MRTPVHESPLVPWTVHERTFAPAHETTVVLPVFTSIGIALSVADGDGTM